jgi:hypothetical protein
VDEPGTNSLFLNIQNWCESPDDLEKMESMLKFLLDNPASQIPILKESDYRACVALSITILLNYIRISSHAEGMKSFEEMEAFIHGDTTIRITEDEFLQHLVDAIGAKIIIRDTAVNIFGKITFRNAYIGT